MNRLEAETNGVGGEIVRRIPKSKGPTSKPRYMTAPLVDAYGFRRQNPRVLFLCPFEFFMYWDVQRVPEPYRSNCNGWSVWCEEGRDHYDVHKHDHDFKLIPGKHYKASIFERYCTGIASTRARNNNCRHQHVHARMV